MDIISLAKYCINGREYVKRSKMDKMSLAKYCINCKYSVYCNDRLLCIKHGVTTENNDYCHDLDERPIVVIREADIYDKENKG